MQLGVAPKIMWAGGNAVIGRTAVRFWHRAGGRLRNRLDVPRAVEGGCTCVVGGPRQCHRFNHLATTGMISRPRWRPVRDQVNAC